MAAPTAVLTHGTAIDIVNEPVSSSVIQSESFTFTSNRDERQSKLYNGAVGFIQKRNPHAKLVLTGFILGNGIAIQEAGTQISALANFASTKHGCDPAVGKIILDDAEDSLTIEDDVSVTLNMTWWPFI